MLGMGELLNLYTISDHFPNVKEKRDISRNKGKATAETPEKVPWNADSTMGREALGGFNGVWVAFYAPFGYDKTRSEPNHVFFRRSVFL